MKNRKAFLQLAFVALIGIFYITAFTGCEESDEHAHMDNDHDNHAMHSDDTDAHSEHGDHSMHNDDDTMHGNHTGEHKEIFNDYCPVRGGEVDPKTPTVEWNGKIWGFCCPGCDSTFLSDPEKYSKNISEDGKEFLGEKTM